MPAEKDYTNAMSHEDGDDDPLGAFLRRSRAAAPPAPPVEVPAPPAPPAPPPKKAAVGPALPPKPKIAVGDDVRIHGLAGRKDLNGARGRVVARHSDTRRFGVKVDAAGARPAATVAIRPRNLAKVDRAAEEAAVRGTAIAGALAGMRQSLAAGRRR